MRTDEPSRGNLGLLPLVLLSDASVLLGTGLLSNVLLYLFHLMAGRLLEPSEFGLFGALYGVVFLSGGVALGFRSLAAKVVASARATGSTREVHEASTGVVAQAALAAVAVLIALTAASPWIAGYVRAEDLRPVLAAGVAVSATLFLSVCSGALQGVERFVVYAMVQLAMAATRLALGVAALAVGLGALGALGSTALSVVVASAVGVVLVRPAWKHFVRLGFRLGRQTGKEWPMVLGLAVISLPTSLDLVMVRHSFSAEESGLYAAATVLGKIVLFASLYVAVLAFPKFIRVAASGQSPRGLLILSVGAVVVLSGTASLVFTVAPGLSLTLLLGDGYTEASQLVRFYAVALALFAIAALSLNYSFAIGRGLAHLLWLFLPHMAVQFGSIPFMDDVANVGLIMLATNGSLAATSLLFALAARTAFTNTALHKPFQ